MEPPAVIPAASLILMRADGTAPEILIVERGRALSFAAGALAFPGGRVDPGDRAAAQGADDPDETAARIAALRETREETGVTLADDGVDALAMLVPYARWRPPALRPSPHFDTRFYLAPAEAAHPTRADGTETCRAFWATASDVIASVEAGAATILFPTRCLLERLARHADFTEARAAALAQPPTLIQPTIERRGNDLWTVIPGDLGYPYRAGRIDLRTR